MALLWALPAKLSCSVPMLPEISIVAGAAPRPEAAKVTLPTWALAVTWTEMLTVPPSGTLAVLTWAMLMAGFGGLGFGSFVRARRRRARAVA